MEPDQELPGLQDKLNNLIQEHRKLQSELTKQSNEINLLSIQINKKPYTPQEKKPQVKEAVPKPKPWAKLSNFQFEKFIGENLFNKIGIIIIILGVVIGAKYSIEHNLITPISRIIIGYLTGIGLTIAALKLKKDYHNFSAVLVSGAMAVFYFDTYVAYGFYDLIPRLAAFAIMFFFTFFTVTAAIKYDRQVIAHIGLVGAYAAPFLLNDNSGRADLLFTYTSILNAGILFIAFRRYWKPLYYFSFAVTWLLYSTWLFNEYQVDAYFLTALLFAVIFFAGFYTMFLVYKLIRKEAFQPDDILVFLVNAFIFYGTGYYILNTNPAAEGYLGLFTLINAFIHAGASYWIYRSRLADQRLFQIVLSVVIVFATLAIPVQLEGNWVTLLWSVWAAALYWFAVRSKQSLFEKYALALMILAAWSMSHDWSYFSERHHAVIPYMTAVPFFNPNFLTALIFTLSFGFIQYMLRSFKPAESTQSELTLRYLTRIVVPFILIAGVWVMFFYETAMIFDQWHDATIVKILDTRDNSFIYHSDWRINGLKFVVLICYTLFYLILLSAAVQKYFMNIVMSKVLNLLITMGILIFLFIGLTITFELQNGYLNPINPDYFPDLISFILIRYLLVLLAAVLVIYKFKYIRPRLSEKISVQWFELFMMFTGIYYLSSELAYTLEFFESSFTSKGITILWAIYASFFIWLGIKRGAKHIRIWAFVVFGVMLIKLFFFDISDVTTITKTILFIIVGALLLLSSFFYNKFKSILFIDENK